MKSATRVPVAQVRALRILTGVFGGVWLANAAFQAEGWLAVPAARANFLGALAGAARHVPAWIRPLLLALSSGVKAVGPDIVAACMVAIAVLLGIALLTRRMTGFAAGLGIVYSAICWIALDGFGFPYANGQTDPGVFVAYAIAFLFVLSVAPIVGPHGDVEPVRRDRLWNLARIGFGLLWLFDAILKWVPAFLLHFTSQITSVIPGQPPWIAVWLGFVAVLIQLIGPVAIATLVGISETVIAAGLLSGRWMRAMIPFAIVYSLAVWSTAEAFGGPYTSAGTGVRGNVLGNVLIYLIPLLFLWVGHREQARQWALQERPRPGS